MDKAQAILAQEFSNRVWQLEKPSHGRQKECYLAVSAEVSVFIKFGVQAPVLQRLGEIGAAPRLLASGTYQGESYIIQELIDGIHPTRGWIGNHLNKVAALMKIYHDDSRLVKLLDSSAGTATYTEQLHNDLSEIEQRVRANEQAARLLEPFLKLRELSASFEASRLVPIHNEPNTTNMLISKQKLIFIDWDEITLSHPMRDIGNFLWWYVPSCEWKDFANVAGVQPAEYSEQKVYWFAARASLVIQLWRNEHKYPGDDFFNDFIAALNMQPNPQIE